METNQNLVQENSAQRIALALEQPAEPLYDPAEAARIVQCLTDGYFDPEYILLFGKLVGGTPHSDAMTCLSWCGKPRNTIGFRPNASCVIKCPTAAGRLPTLISIS